MGIDAHVFCDCLKKNRTTPPPFPPGRIVQRDGEWQLDVPHQGHEQEYDDLDRWVTNACPHPRMVLVSESATWESLIKFLTAAQSCGRVHFPTVVGQFSKPEGEIPSRLAKLALQELCAFNKGEHEGKLTWLVDSETGQEIEQYVPSRRGVIYWGTSSHRFEIGVRKNGFFVVKRRSGKWKWFSRPIFRSMRIEQELFKDPEGHEWAKYTDRDSGRTCVTDRPLQFPVPRFTKNGMEFDAPRFAQVEERPVNPRDYFEITASLMRVFEASRDTGNSVFFG